MKTHEETIFVYSVVTDGGVLRGDYSGDCISLLADVLKRKVRKITEKSKETVININIVAQKKVEVVEE